jgi:hypothetical protein
MWTGIIIGRCMLNRVDATTNRAVTRMTTTPMTRPVQSAALPRRRAPQRGQNRAGAGALA